MSFVLGIDVSTTATKAVLVDDGGRVVAVGASEYPFAVPQPLWAEQDPELWWHAACTAIRAALATAGARADQIAGVGLTGQMHGLVLLDDADRVLRPAILWNDQRTAAECDLIRAAIGPQRLIEITGNDALTGFTAPKLVWVREHEPDVWRRIAHVLLPKDYLRLRLTGDYALDKAGGSGTILFELAARDWSAVVTDALAIDRRWLPATFEGPSGHGHRQRGRGSRHRPACRDTGGGRWRRPIGQCRGRGCHRARRGGALAGYVGGRICRDRHAVVRAGRSRPCFLPRGSRTLAHDVGDALGGR